MTDMTTTFHECVEFDVTTSLKWQRDGGNWLSARAAFIRPVA